MSKDIDFLKKVFLSELDSGKKSHIIKVEGAESGHDHLRIYTQSAEQKENGIVTLFMIFSTEIEANCEIGIPLPRMRIL